MPAFMRDIFGFVWAFDDILERATLAEWLSLSTEDAQAAIDLYIQNATPDQQTKLIAALEDALTQEVRAPYRERLQALLDYFRSLTGR